MKIEIEKRENGWYVRYGHLWEDRLTIDEALGAVVSIMFGSGKPMYLRNDVQHFLWHLKYGDHLPLLPERAESLAEIPF